MIGIVVASHSHALAQAAVDLALDMVDQAACPPVRLAAGLPDGVLGTDATAISAAIEELADTDGVLVLVDLGSAVLSSQMALEFLDPELAARVVVSSAPLLEGLVAAVVTASAGAPLETAALEAERALAPKLAQLGFPAAEGAEAEPGEPQRIWSTTINLPNGLHARPSAMLVAALSPLDADVVLTVAGRPARADGRSMTQIQSLDARLGDQLVAHIGGPDAERAEAALQELAAGRFGESADLDALAALAAPHEDEWPLELSVDVGVYRPGDVAEEERRVVAAISSCRDFLEGLVESSAGQPTSDLPGGRVTSAVLGAVGSMLHDPTLARGLRRRVQAGEDACTAVHQTLQETASIFEHLDSPYLRERATDLRALERLLLRSLLGLSLPLLDIPQHRVLVVDELDAITAAQIDPDTCPGVRVCAPGETGHGVVVARARGLNVSVARAGARGLPVTGAAAVPLAAPQPR